MMKLFGNCLAQEGEAKEAMQASRKKKVPALSTLCSWLLNRKPKKATISEEDEEEKKGGIRLKLVLSKKEAAQLLAFYVQGQEEMVNKLVGFKLDKQKIQQSRSSFGAWQPMLESIPED
ncbi:hypothetical protein Cni_G02537 [Canna indica]|uniref:Uncharacterized protein n=1 Tax=Canna indica TaxID=4628 RepID=A0AAQ3JS90_9LILI|nr:hypothetical protein Cni_G02537 [Canna indica]